MPIRNVILCAFLALSTSSCVGFTEVQFERYLSENSDRQKAYDGSFFTIGYFPILNDLSDNIATFMIKIKNNGKDAILLNGEEITLNSKNNSYQSLNRKIISNKILKLYNNDILDQTVVIPPGHEKGGYVVFFLDLNENYENVDFDVQVPLSRISLFEKYRPTLVTKLSSLSTE